MLGHPLITRALNDDDRLGTILAVVKDADSYILKGRLLYPTRVKDNLITATTVERLTWNEPLEIFDSVNEDRQLLGAANLEKEGKNILFIAKIISEKHCNDIVRIVKKMGINAFDRMYPIFPVMAIKEEHQICNICENPIGKNGCEHVAGKVYLRTNCRTKVLEAKVQQLIWSGVKQFNT